MAKFVKGDVVIVPFPFSDLSQSKRRPALVIADLDGDDLILRQITSQANKDQNTISIADNDYESGGLKQISNVRPNRLFTMDSKIVLYRAGKLRKGKMNDIIGKLIEIINS
ncbi:MAG: type II toxin-antitoxin system PemK/MazF family toxin [Nitrospinaceae bacterium]